MSPRPLALILSAIPKAKDLPKLTVEPLRNIEGEYSGCSDDGLGDGESYRNESRLRDASVFRTCDASCQVLVGPPLKPLTGPPDPQENGRP